MATLWGGRFTKSANALAQEFSASIGFDCALARYDIAGSIAHATMLGRTGIISPAESEQLVAGLKKVWKKIEAGEAVFRIEDEDIHMNVEKILTQEIGSVAGKLHTARSRNDQVALDFHLYLREESLAIVEQICALQAALITQAKNNIDAIIPGYTHLQRAQPVRFAHHLLAYVHMLQRDAERFCDAWKRINVSPLGAGALAGTTFPIDRAFVAEALGFDGVYENSMDAVSDRDFVVEFLSNASLMMTHLSRLCEELILWSSREFSFVELDDAFCTGSSIMPQKKNADMAELIRGKTGRVYGALFGLLTVLKGLPLTYNKDMQEDKEGTFDVVETLRISLPVMSGMISSMQIKADVTLAAARNDFSNATDLADYLAKKGIPFREAHEITGKTVLFCIEKNCRLLDLELKEFKRFSELVEQDIFDVLAIETVVNRRNVQGGPAKERVQDQLLICERNSKQIQLRLEEMQKKIARASIA